MAAPSSARRGERAGTAGALWQTVAVRREVVVEDGPWGGPAVVRAWTAPEPDPAPWQPTPPANRAQRRAARRALRKGQQR